jgi:hypothetical protein
MKYLPWRHCGRDEPQPFWSGPVKQFAYLASDKGRGDF